jgi:hypothetical protein
MSRFTPLVVLALVLTLTSCSEEPLVTATDQEATFLQSESLAKGGADVLKNQLLYEGTDIEDGPYFIPCLNDGLGENITFTISYSYIANVVTTPSGNQHYNGWLDEWASEFTGETTGEHWVGSGIAHVAEHVKSDGTYRAMEPLHEMYMNDDTGEKLKLLWHYKASPAVPFSFEIISCTVFD